MIWEWIESWRTPASREAKRLGYLYESVALQARQKRCADSWRAHLENCHRVILRETADVTGTLMILGSGPLAEIPIDQLRARLQKIILVDFVHPRPVRKRFARDPQIEFIQADLLGVAAPLLAWSGGPLPKPKPPELPKVDFVLSANCLSQLALRPRAFLQGKIPDDQLDDYCEALSVAHLKQLKKLAPRQLVIADYESRVFNRFGKELEITQPFFDAGKLHKIEDWQWQLAPRGEISTESSLEMTVGAFTP